jgi:hypothetical protein
MATVSSPTSVRLDPVRGPGTSEAIPAFFRRFGPPGTGLADWGT